MRPLGKMKSNIDDVDIERRVKGIEGESERWSRDEEEARRKAFDEDFLCELGEMKEKRPFL